VCQSPQTAQKSTHYSTLYSTIRVHKHQRQQIILDTTQRLLYVFVMPTAQHAQESVGQRRTKPKALSQQQLLFAKSLATQGNPVTAYREAGYITNPIDLPNKVIQGRAYSVARSTSVRAAVARFRAEIEAKREEKQQITRDWVIAELQEALARAKKPMLGNDAVAVRVLELLGKHLGMFTDTMTIDIGRTREYDELTAAEGRKLAALMLAGAGDSTASEPPQDTHEDQCEHTEPGEHADIEGISRVLSLANAEPTPPSPPDGPGVSVDPSPEITR
jgi:hypothetical protein